MRNVYVLEEHTDQFRRALLGTTEPRGYDIPPDLGFKNPRDHFGSHKTNDCLFRVRFIWDEDGYHEAPSHSKMGFGYPLYIAERHA